MRLSVTKYVIRFRPGYQRILIERAVRKAGSQRKLSKLWKIPRRTIRNYEAEENLLPP